PMQTIGAAAMIDLLEARYLLASVSATFHSKTGIVDVEGTNQPDTISFAIVKDTKGSHLHVSSGSSVIGSFTASKVSAIRVNCGDGNDSVTVGSIGIATTVDGGAGDDALLGGDKA